MPPTLLALRVYLVITDTTPGHTPQAACNFSSSSVRKAWFKEPPKKSWWSEPPKKPSRAAQFVENIVIGAICVGSIGYGLTLPTVTDRLKAEMKNLDIFGVEQLRDDLEKQIRTSQKPNEAINHDDCIPSASKIGSDSASGRGQIPESNLLRSENHSSLLLAAAQAQDAEAQEAERMRLANTRIPSPNSEDPEERLAAYWKDPKNKPELSEWWDNISSGLIGQMIIPILSRNHAGELEVIKEEKGMVYE
ncbi:MAG: hypothetical protein LQ339_001942 [Xanthoria mediterranea]|nr:MAG: hypothetical protein LQ339_001942 [Xanthoria mediterranea]